MQLRVSTYSQQHLQGVSGKKHRCYTSILSGIFVMLANAPIGQAIWSGFPTIGNWLNNSGQIPAMRAFLITGALGLLAFGLRALLGKERGFYAGAD